MKFLNTILRKLTYQHLQDWAGETILNRGRNYIQKVSQLSFAGENTLIARVKGNTHYATSVQINKIGEFEHRCTCPYDRGPCKHAVALILAAADQVRNDLAIPPLDENSDLLNALARKSDIEDEWDDDDSITWAEQRSQTRARVEKILEKKTKKDLLALLIELSDHYADVFRFIIESEQLDSGQPDKLVRSLSAEIRTLTAEPVWYDGWRDQGNLPDFSHIEEQLGELARRGHADAVVRLGEELWTQGKQQVEQSHDEGETAMAIAACLEIVLTALPQSSLAPVQQLLWVIDRILEDDFSMLDSADPFLKKRMFTRTHWREVCAALETRLNDLPKPASPGFSDRYRREQLLSQLLFAFQRAGWKDRIIPTLEQQVDACQCYKRLVDALLEANERDRARHWCIQGYTNTVEESPGIASALQKQLRLIAQEERRYDLVAAYRAQDFFARPSATDYRELRKAAEKVKCWPSVREAALLYLETGKHPAEEDRPPSNEIWPLPAPEVGPPTTSKRAGVTRFPDLVMLIEIAILEKRVDDVVELYRRLGQTKRWGQSIDKEVARAVVQTHPDIALGIWKVIADSLIAEVKPKAYQEAATYLHLMRKTYTRLGRGEEWQTLLDGLRSSHKAKRRLMGVLDSVSNKRLVD